MLSYMLSHKRNVGIELEGNESTSRARTVEDTMANRRRLRPPMLACLPCPLLNSARVLP